MDTQLGSTKKLGQWWELRVTEAVLEVFANRRLIHQVNATSLVLIPKNNHPTTLRDYRPLACCNVLYKVVSKILVNRL